jgi:hypothetical protein
MKGVACVCSTHSMGSVPISNTCRLINEFFERRASSSSSPPPGSPGSSPGAPRSPQQPVTPTSSRITSPRAAIPVTSPRSVVTPTQQTARSTAISVWTGTAPSKWCFERRHQLEVALKRQTQNVATLTTQLQTLQAECETLRGKIAKLEPPLALDATALGNNYHRLVSVERVEFIEQFMFAAMVMVVNSEEASAMLEEVEQFLNDILTHSWQYATYLIEQISTPNIIAHPAVADGLRSAAKAWLAQNHRHLMFQVVTMGGPPIAVAATGSGSGSAVATDATRRASASETVFGSVYDGKQLYCSPVIVQPAMSAHVWKIGQRFVNYWNTFLNKHQSKGPPDAGLQYCVLLNNCHRRLVQYAVNCQNLCLQLQLHQPPIALRCDSLYDAKFFHTANTNATSTSTSALLKGSPPNATIDRILYPALQTANGDTLVVGLCRLLSGGT